MSYQPQVTVPSDRFLADMHEIQLANLHKAMAPEDGVDHSDELRDDELSHLDYDLVKNGEQFNPYTEEL